MTMLRYKLRTLLIMLAVGPLALWVLWLIYAMFDDALRIGF